MNFGSLFDCVCRLYIASCFFFLFFHSYYVCLVISFHCAVCTSNTFRFNEYFRRRRVIVAFFGNTCIELRSAFITCVRYEDGATICANIWRKYLHEKSIWKWQICEIKSNLFKKKLKISKKTKKKKLENRKKV